MVCFGKKLDQKSSSQDLNQDASILNGNLTIALNIYPSTSYLSHLSTAEYGAPWQRTDTKHTILKSAWAWYTQTGLYIWLPISEKSEKNK